MSNKLWNKCVYCGKIIAYLRPARRVGCKIVSPTIYYDWSMVDAFSGSNPDYVCKKCHDKN